MATKCEGCGAAKPVDSRRCPACEKVDEDVMRKEIAGIPGLSLLVLALVVFSAYRFWLIGWPAWSGNLRLAAICAGGLGITALITGSLWTFGIRNRKRALIVTAIATAGFLILNNL